VILSAKAKVAKKRLQLFAAGERDPYARTIMALRKALQRAGVVLIPENARGRSVRLPKKGKR
jgi:hypothetical protein